MRTALLLVLLTSIVTGARAQDATEWGTFLGLERLFPPPASGWSVSEMEVRELKTFAQLSGLEEMFDLVRGISGTPAKPPSVRYQLSREYSEEAHRIYVLIDSEDMESAGFVLMAHGYSHMEDGKPVPLSTDKKPLQQEVLNVVRPFRRAGHLAVEWTEDQQIIVVLLLGDSGVISFACEYTNCLGDIDDLMERIDLQLLDEFARFEHRKQDKAKG